jgi:hypothetical protein
MRKETPMLTKIFSFGLFLMLLCAVPLLVATPANLSIRLPADFVTMVAVYGNNSYFDIALSDIPEGYDIINGAYHGWCVQENIKMTQHVNHTVRLYSCYDPSLPFEYQNNHWDKINYLLNHKQGSLDSIQQAIWYYTDDKECFSDPDAWAMVLNAEQHGAGFIPAIGQLLAVPIEGIPTIQLTFLETTIPAPSTLEGLVWNDTNANGLQDSGEPGLGNIMVYLYQQNNFLINTTTTNNNGYYHFTNLVTGAYYLQITLRSGYRFSPQDVGTNDSKDSDVSITGQTPIFYVTIDQNTQRWDAGMYSPSRRGGTSQNHRPTADGTAGEPYNGFIYEPITFDGSRSYDRDGRIITWWWNCGDGTNESGEIISHSYDAVGNYTVTLTVTDNMFASDVYTTVAHITSGNNPPSPPTVSGFSIGHARILYEYFFTSTDSDNDTIRYIINWDDDHTETTFFFASGRPVSMTHEWDTYGFYTVQVYAQDQHNAISIPSQMTIAIDVQYVAGFGYLIDTNGDGIFELFHSNSTSIETSVKLLDDGNYLIDINGDGEWDIIYNPTTHQYQEYQAFPLLEYLFFILLLIVFILLYQIFRIKRQTRTFSSRKK